MKTHITISNGNSLEINNTVFCLEDGKYSLEIKPYRKASREQFGYWFGVICPHAVSLLQEMGWPVRSIEDAHEFLKREFFKEKIINENTGEIKYGIKSFAKARKEEISKLYEDVWLFFSEYGYDIPRPNEYGTSNL